MAKTATQMERAQKRKQTMLRKMRLGFGLFVRDVATEVDIDPSHLSLLECGKRTPSLDVAKRLAAFYETTVDELFPARNK